MNNRPETSLANTLQALSQALSVLVGSDAPSQLRTRPDPRLEELISSLPRLTEVDLGSLCDSVCPICLVQFRAHLAEEETASAMDSPAHADQDLGVTRLESTCKHTFCRKDISVWIRQSRNSCPTCRRPLLDPLLEEGSLHQDDANRSPAHSVSHDRQDDTAAQIADNMIREVLEALGPLDGETSSDQADVMRRLVETLLSGTSEFQAPSTDEDYPERDEFGMYS